MSTSTPRSSSGDSVAAQLAGAKRIQADVSKALGLGSPLPTEVAALDVKYEAALDAFEAAWKETHVVT